MLRYYITIIMIISFASLEAHEQEMAPVHQRIVVEKYHLLKFQFGKESEIIANIDYYITGAKEYEISSYWHNNSMITSGSDQENRHNIACGIVWPFCLNTHFCNIDDTGRRQKK